MANTTYYTSDQLKIMQSVPLDPMEGIRTERNRLLYLCDWTQTSDAVLSNAAKTAWLTYRQALRDLPSKYTTPETVVFPIVPSIK